jgi:hypothetical protein
VHEDDRGGDPGLQGGPEPLGQTPTGEQRGAGRGDNREAGDTEQRVGEASAVADSKQTLLCTYLSGVLVVGLALNSLFGWSWADPIAALVIAGVAVKEGREAWRGDGCCSPAEALRLGALEAGDDACGCKPGCDCCT